MSAKAIRSGVPLFDMGVLGRQIKHVSHVPEHGVRVVNIDTSQCSDNPRSDLSALCAGLVHIDEHETRQSTLWITHVEFGHYTAKELPVVIGSFMARYGTDANRATIEKINGSAFLRVLVEAEFERLQIHPRKLTWTSARNLSAKATRIGKLVRLSQQDRLRLVAAPWNDEFLREAESWLGTSSNSGRHEDCLDAAAGLAAGIVGL